jgi:hypothetical protein
MNGFDIEIETIPLEELNRAVAKAKGWPELPHPIVTLWQKPIENRVETVFTLPFWSTDVGSTYELEDKVPEDEKYLYFLILFKLVSCDVAMPEEMHVYGYRLIHATTEQRCRAYLLWKKGGRSLVSFTRSKDRKNGKMCSTQPTTTTDS